MLFPVMALARDNMAQEILGHAVNYDHVVIDGPPRAETLSRAVIIASDLIVIPIEASGASDWASQTTIQQVQEARQYKETLKSVFLVSRVIFNTVISRSIRDHVADHGIPLLRATVANRVAFAEALTMGKTIFEWAPSSAAARSFQLLCKKSERSMSKKNLKKPLPNRQPTSDEWTLSSKAGRGKTQKNIFLVTQH